MVINYNLIGRRVAVRREQLRLTQAELAEKTELTPKYISNIETAHSIPSIKSVMQLCMALDVNPDYLLLGTADEKIVTQLDEANRLLSVCTPQQLDKVIEYIEFLTNR